MIRKETLDEVSNLLGISASWVEGSTPQFERILSALDKLINGEVAIKFRETQTAQQVTSTKRRCRDRIELVKEAVASGISEEGALRILFSVYPEEPEKGSMEIATDTLSKLSIPNLMGAFVPRHQHPSAIYPFPSVVPSGSASVEEFPSEARADDEMNPEE